MCGCRGRWRGTRRAVRCCAMGSGRGSLGLGARGCAGRVCGGIRSWVVGGLVSCGTSSPLGVPLPCVPSIAPPSPSVRQTKETKEATTRTYICARFPGTINRSSPTSALPVARIRFSPLAVSGMSVTPVWRPLSDHSVSPWRTMKTRGSGIVGLFVSV